MLKAGHRRKERDNGLMLWHRCNGHYFNGHMYCGHIVYVQWSNGECTIVLSQWSNALTSNHDSVSLTIIVSNFDGSRVGVNNSCTRGCGRHS